MDPLHILSSYFEDILPTPEISGIPKIIKYGTKRKMPCIIIYGDGTAIFYYDKSFLELDFPEKISCYYAQNPSNIKKTLKLSRPTVDFPEMTTESRGRTIKLAGILEILMSFSGIYKIFSGAIYESPEVCCKYSKEMEDYHHSYFYSVYDFKCYSYRGRDNLYYIIDYISPEISEKNRTNEKERRAKRRAKRRD